MMTTASDFRPKARLPHPDKFDGTNKAAFPQFEGSLRAKLSIDSEVIGGEHEKVWYAFGRLSGDAAVRIYPWLSYAEKTGQFTVENIFAQMTIAFRDPHYQQKALDALNRLKQGKRSLTDFMNDFNKLLLEAEGWGWEDSIKKGYLKAALSFRLRRAMVGVIESSLYDEYCTQLRTVNDQLEQLGEVENFQQRWNKNTDDVMSRINRTAPQEAMDWQPTSAVSAAVTRTNEPRWASDDEIARRRREGLCLRCGRKGHRVRNCTAELKKQNVNSANVRTDQIAVMEDEKDKFEEEGSGKA